jgi:predicted GNAT family acetyltransferase
MSATEANVNDDRVNRRFVLDREGAIAELLYDVESGQLILLHTEVPNALGGRGIGGLLLRAAVERARADHLTIVPQCPFARRWLAQHPDVAPDIDIRLVDDRTQH